MRGRGAIGIWCLASTLACGNASPTQTARETAPATASSDAGTPSSEAPRDAGTPALPAPDASPAPPEDTRPTVRLFPEGEMPTACADAELRFDFDPKPRAFNADHAFWMMWFTRRAFFSDAPSTPAELSSVGFDRFAHTSDPDTGLQVYVAGSRRAVIVAFRGSDETQDWLGDFNFPQDEGERHGVTGRVHRGFARSIEPSLAWLDATITSFADSAQPIWITGHSLGGAQAALTAARLAERGLPVAPLYVFGAPRVGDRGFAESARAALSGLSYVIANEADIVPRLPPTAAAADEAKDLLPIGKESAANWVRELDYMHVGGMWWFETSESSALVPIALGEDEADRSYWAATAKGGTLGALQNNQDQSQRHDPAVYLCKMAANRSRTGATAAKAP